MTSNAVTHDLTVTLPIVKTDGNLCNSQRLIASSLPLTGGVGNVTTRSVAGNSLT